jgi:signal transduction histidine kinase
MDPDKQPLTQREQTDESLRAEREKVDEALAEKLAAIDETADEVILRARQKADAVLAAARSKSDHEKTTTTSPAASAERGLADKVLKRERAAADETLRQERAETVELLAAERDETDKDLSTERLHADAAIATRDEFLAMVSHDLRSMLATVVGSATLIDTLASKTPGLENATLHAARIHRAGKRMGRLIGDLIDVASIEAGVLAVSPESTDASLVVTEAVESLLPQAEAAGISLNMEVGAPGLLAVLDPARILQVMTNLLSNAVKFTPRGGKVLAKVETFEGGLRFSVRDTGRGIPPNQLENVFKRFMQLDRADRRGVGLGLYISRCIVESHHGKISAESKLGQGTLVSFTIPPPTPAAGAADSGPAAVAG